MSGELKFLLECPACGNFQFFREVRAQVYEVHFAATHGKIEYGQPEKTSSPVVLRIICGYCGKLVHDNQVGDPLIRDRTRYKDAETIFQEVPK